jgi:hypothetical protein
MRFTSLKEKKSRPVEPLRPAGLPVFTGSAPVYTVLFRFICKTVLRINRAGYWSGSRFDRFDRPVRSGSDNLDEHNLIFFFSLCFFRTKKKN